MKKLVFGTSNAKKVEELKTLLSLYGLDMDVVSLKDIGFDEEIDENGTTLEENSLIKANAVKSFCDRKGIKADILTDDAGLCVGYLNGEPGVRTGRYAGDKAKQEENIAKLLGNMEGAKGDERSATHECVLTYLPVKGRKIVTKGVTKGIISENIGALAGQTFWPVFIPDGSRVPLSEISKEELAKSNFSYRKNAFIELLTKMKELEDIER